MKVDAIILTNTASQQYYDLTLNCIRSMQDSEIDVEFQPIIIESSQTLWEYPGAVIQVKGEFNYNRSLNAGLSEASSDYTVISNNDVVFYPNWFRSILAGMERNSLNTASPRCTRFILHRNYTDDTEIIGWQTSYVFAGFCLVLDRRARELLYPLDEKFSFAYQDDDMARVLMGGGLRHGLIGKAKIEHLEAQSHKLVEADRLNLESQEYFKEKYQC